MHDVHTSIVHMLTCSSHVEYEHFLVDVSAKLGHEVCFCELLIWTKTGRKIERFLKYLLKKMMRR